MFQVKTTDTALDITDPQNDFLSPQGVTWAMVGESVTQNKTVVHIEDLFKAAKQAGLHVFVSPHYYYPTNHGWKFEGTLEKVMHDIHMFDRDDALSLAGFEGSGADWLEEYKPSNSQSILKRMTTMQSFIKFNLGLIRSRPQVRLWLLLLLAVNLASPLFFWQRTEAQVVLLALVASMGVMTVLTGFTGFTHLLGLGHIFWIPMNIWLWSRLDQIPAGDAFGVWIRVLIAVNTISLVIDAVDVGRYLTGDREEMAKLTTSPPANGDSL